MSAKEIEELLNDIKKQLTIEERLGKEIAKDFHKTTLNYKEIKLLLSYIEQLENNRDKAIEYISKTVFNEKGYINFCYELENILKGDSMKISELMLDPKFDLDKYVEDLKKKVELGNHYKHLYSEVKKQKDDVVEYIKIYRSYEKIDNKDYLKGRDEIGTLSVKQVDDLLRMLGETDE